MDPAKQRILAGIGGALFGFTGILGLMGALTVAIAPQIGYAAGAALSGVMFIIFGGGLLFVFLKPNKSASKEINQLEDATADALADLPFDTMKSMIEKRPLAMASIAALVGYGLANDRNGLGSKTLQRVLFGLI